MYANSSNDSCAWIWCCLIVICIVVLLCISSSATAASNSYYYANSLGISSWNDIQNKLVLGLAGPYISKYIVQTINNLSANVKQTLINNINNGTILNNPVYQQIKSEIIPKIDQEIMANNSVPANVKDYINNNIISKLIDSQFVQNSSLIKSLQQ